MREAILATLALLIPQQQAFEINVSTYATTSETQTRSVGGAQRALLFGPGGSLQQPHHLFGLKTTGILRGSRTKVRCGPCSGWSRSR